MARNGISMLTNQPDDHDFRDNHFGYCRECGRPAAVHLQAAGVNR